MIQTPKRTGIEWVNRAVLSWREMDRLKDPDKKAIKGRHTHTHTHTHTHRTSSQVRPSLVPLRHLAQLPLPGQHKPDQGEESGAQPSSWGSRSLSSVKAGGVPVLGEDGHCAAFYSVLMLVWHVTNQWLSLLRPCYTEVVFSILLGTTELLWHFVTVIMRTGLREGSVNLDIWPLEWVRNYNIHVYFRSGIFIFLYIFRSKMG